MEISGEDLKKHWKNLRDSYSKHLRSLKTHTGQAASTNSYKTWPWAKNMDFLRPFLKFSKTATNVCNDDNGSNELPQCNYLSQTENLAASTNLETSLNPTTPILKRTMEESENVDTDVEAVIPRTKKKLIKETVSGCTSGVDKVISFLKQKKSDTESMDATELMFLGYAKTIKTFSARRQALTKMKISQLVMEQNLLQIEENEEKSSLGNSNFQYSSDTTPSASAASWYEDFSANMDEFHSI